MSNTFYKNIYIKLYKKHPLYIAAAPLFFLRISGSGSKPVSLRPVGFFHTFPLHKFCTDLDFHLCPAVIDGG